MDVKYICVTFELIGIITVTLLQDSEAVCCGFWDYRCDDGSVSSIFACCGRGPCNIFCCNCQYGCKKATDCGTVGDECTKSVQDLQNVILRFNGVDDNGDQKINVQEAFKYLNIEFEYQDLNNLPEWFSEMDKNGNGLIEPGEFDKDLDDFLSSN